MEKYVLALELIGTVAFALSGVLVGVKKNLDLFGVVMVGVIAACGGGILRDAFLGQLPPVMFTNPIYALTAVIVSCVMLVPRVYRFAMKNQRAYDLTMLISDSVGVGLFTAAGMSAVVSAGYGNNLFLMVFIGTLTGVGGGLLRDLVTQTLPYIFTKHFYACACIIGALAGGLLWDALGQQTALMVCAVTVFVVRLRAARFRWKMPTAEKWLGRELAELEEMKEEEAEREAALEKEEEQSISSSPAE